MYEHIIAVLGTDGSASLPALDVPLKLSFVIPRCLILTLFLQKLIILPSRA